MIFYLIFLAYYLTGVTLGLVEYFRGSRDDRSVSGAGADVYAIWMNGIWWPVNLVVSWFRRRAARRVDA